MKANLERWFQEYAEYHRHPINQLTHKIAIPAIVFHILAMLDWIDLVPLFELPGSGTMYHLSVGHLFFVAVLTWYFTLNAKFALISLFAFLPLFLIGAYTPAWVVIAVAVAAWLIQLAGHVIWEKRSPAFLTNLLQALIGPLFFIAIYAGDWPVKGTAATANV